MALSFLFTLLQSLTANKLARLWTASSYQIWTALSGYTPQKPSISWVKNVGRNPRESGCLLCHSRWHALLSQPSILNRSRKRQIRANFPLLCGFIFVDWKKASFFFPTHDQVHQLMDVSPGNIYPVKCSINTFASTVTHKCAKTHWCIVKPGRHTSVSTAFKERCKLAYCLRTTCLHATVFNLSLKQQNPTPNLQNG